MEAKGGGSTPSRFGVSGGVPGRGCERRAHWGPGSGGGPGT